MGKSLVRVFIHSLSKSVSSPCWVPDVVPGTNNFMVNKALFLSFRSLWSSEGQWYAVLRVNRLAGSREERGQGLACLEKVASQLKSENSGSQPMMGGWGK